MQYSNLKPDKSISYYSWNHQAHFHTDFYFKYFYAIDSRDKSACTVKIIEKSSFPDIFTYISSFYKEISSYSKLKLINCVKYKDVIQFAESIVLIEQFYYSEGDLRSQITKKNGLFTEIETAKIIESIIKGFESLNSHDIIHGDLKPETILLSNKKYFLSNYGLNSFLSNLPQPEGNDDIFTYKSPQMLLNEKYSFKTDVWSLGIVIYELIYGILPWSGGNKHEYSQNIKKIPIRFSYNINISETTKDFIKGCLQYNESQRFGWVEILKHPFFTNIDSLGSNQKSIRRELLTLNEKIVVLIKEIQNIITKQNVNIDKLFKKLDKSGDEKLDCHEFTKFIMIIDSKFTNDEIQEVFNKFDFDNDGNISLEEFKKMIIEMDCRNKDENELLAQFRGKSVLQHIISIILENQLDITKIINQFDSTGDKLLKFGEFLPLMKVFIPDMTDQDGKFVFKIFDKNSDGEISSCEIQEFLEIELAKRANEKPKVKNTGKKTMAMKILDELRKVIYYNNLQLPLVFKSFDLSGDSRLDFHEFCKLIEVINARHTEQELKDVFTMFDTDSDQFINFNEFKNLIQNTEN